ncbi:MAG: MATE family efflux transporter, partial [Candidatus Methanomethylophilaceae archaeon]
MSADGGVEVVLGEPRKAIVAMAIPLIISMIVAAVNTVADRMWCAGLGSDSLAAIALVEPIYLVIMGIGNGFGVGAAAVVSRLIGAGDRDRASGCAVNAVVFSLVFGMVLTPFLVLISDPLLEAIGSDDIIGVSSDYMLQIVLFTFIHIMYGTLSGTLRGEGATKMARTMAVIMAVSNIVLDPVLIYGFGMGIAGAGLSTSVATMLAVVFALVLYLDGRMYIHMPLRGFRFHRENLTTVLQVGVPQTLEYTVMYAMNIVLNYIVIWCAGSDGLTIYSVPNIVLEMALIPAMAIGSALVPVASSAFGQRNPERMGVAFRYAARLSVGIVGLFCIVIFIIPEPFLYIFTYTSEMEVLRPQMVDALRIYCLFLPAFTLI